MAQLHLVRSDQSVSNITVMYTLSSQKSEPVQALNECYGISGWKIITH